ncbi:MAG: hypothetical protein PHS79_02175 [Patescibacteria group bacterium]|nr:hypothetical protein [Patescibacteria group bacterium]
MSFLVLAASAVRADEPPNEPKEAPLVTTGCSVVGMFYSVSGPFVGCSRGTDGFGIGAFGGVYHPLPPVQKFGLDGDGYLMLRWTAGPLGFRLNGGAGANAETKSASVRMRWLVGTVPDPVGITVFGAHDYYPASWNFSGSDANAGQYDADIRFGPSFLIPGKGKVSVIPFVGVGFADSRQMDQWRARTGFLIGVPL